MIPRLIPHQETRLKQPPALQNLFAAAAMVAMLATGAPAQHFTTMMTFAGSNGLGPHAALVQGVDGDLYGTTSGGGTHGQGTVFKVTASGALTTLYNFCAATACADGASPMSGLTADENGDFYGTTQLGGTTGNGTIFKLTRTGRLLTMYSFDVVHGSQPAAALLKAPNGSFYGTTMYGGSGGYGTVFRLTPRGALTVLHSFTSNADGAYPVAPLLQARDGDLYGTTFGVNGYGTIFKITLAGAITTLHNFCSHGIPCDDGLAPNAGLLQAWDGSLYGATESGGNNNNRGVIFKLTPTQEFIVLHRFESTEGEWPAASLIQANDGHLYGTTQLGGRYGQGTIFVLSTSGGHLGTLHDFNGLDGNCPYASLLQGTNGRLYGATYSDSAYHNGTIFALDLGLSPLIATRPGIGKEGSSVSIIGTDLRGANAVAFNGVSASFTRLSDTLIRSTVPAGASTGRVQVMTPDRILTSSGPFQVRK